MRPNTLSTMLLGDLGDRFITDDGVTLNQLKNDVSCAMTGIRAAGIKKIALFHSDAYIFLVWLLAAWQEKREVLIPAEKNIASNSELNKLFKIGEFDDADLRNWDAYTLDKDVIFNVVDTNLDAIAVYTSGSTGTPVRINKKIWQLENEIESMEISFGSDISIESRFIRSVSHQHFFGLPFGLFWPITRGSRISRFTIKVSYELNCITKHVLITSPSFLKNLSQSSEAHSSIALNMESIFCAGGVLDKETFSSIKELTNTRLVDIYGSSETGHIAWRTDPNKPWNIQQGVEFKNPIKDVLEIRSKFCPSYEWVRTSDLAEASGDSFEILGRVDQIIKIEGTRISLSQLISSISSCDLVEDCLIDDLDRGSRSQLGAVLILSKLGIEVIEKHGKLYVTNLIKEFIKDKVNSISIPRRWRFVSSFPKNSIGKTLKVDLDHLFSTQLCRPTIISWEMTQSSQDLLLDMSKDLTCFEGHFDGFPVVPGVALVEWAIFYAKEGFLDKAVFIGMSQIKFLQVVKPNDIVRLRLDWDSVATSLKFQYFNNEAIFSTGVLKFKKE
jgi:acyl-coenzyme A synthetase/AMP-(fatty) acid ligase/3-hydroxymyristoyl/3-hydroxydecanoyl-(acyl carrier protein) dehydratase